MCQAEVNRAVRSVHPTTKGPTEFAKIQLLGSLQIEKYKT